MRKGLFAVFFTESKPLLLERDALDSSPAIEMECGGAFAARSSTLCMWLAAGLGDSSLGDSNKYMFLIKSIYKTIHYISHGSGACIQIKFVI